MKTKIFSSLLALLTIQGMAAQISVCLDEYLTNLGITKEQNVQHVQINPTYDAKTQCFATLLRTNPNIKTIAEIGFGFGHSSEFWLSARSDIKVVSFDWMSHRHSDTGKQYIDLKYPGRHRLIRGNSLTRVPSFIKKNQGFSFDLIFIDGGHEYEIALQDLIHMKTLARDDTVLIINDIECEPVHRAWQECIASGLVQELERRTDCSFGWAAGKYLKNQEVSNKDGFAGGSLCMKQTK